MKNTRSKNHSQNDKKPTSSSCYAKWHMLESITKIHIHMKLS